MPSKKFRYFRFLRFALLSLLPILLLCVLITRQSHKWASDILRQNAADMLDKNVALIDQRLSSIVTSIHPAGSQRGAMSLVRECDRHPKEHPERTARA